MIQIDIQLGSSNIVFRDFRFVNSSVLSLGIDIEDRVMAHGKLENQIPLDVNWGIFENGK